MLLFEHYSHKFLDKILQEGPQDSLLDTAPLMSTLTSTWCHAHDLFSQAFPLRFCILQAIENWRQEWPGNEASVSGLRSIFLVMCTTASNKLHHEVVYSLIPMPLVVPSMLRSYFSGKICVPGLLWHRCEYKVVYKLTSTAAICRRLEWRSLGRTQTRMAIHHSAGTIC